MTSGGAAFGWDPAKAASNLASHGVSFDSAADFRFATALVVNDDRQNHGEIRKIAFGLIHGRVPVLVYTERGAHIRVISLRKANDREVKLHASFSKQEGHDGRRHRTCPRVAR